MAAWYPQTNELFLKAIEIETADERQGFLDAACGGDTTLRSEVERLVQAHFGAGSFLEGATAGLDPQETLPPPPSLPSAGQALGGYELMEELGRGGMGVVYKARQVALNRVVAVKMVLAGAHAHPEDRQRFLREAEAVARVQHPNVVQIHEVGEHEGQVYLALEYVDGPTLAERCGGTPQDPRWTAEVVRVLAGAVHHAHERGGCIATSSPATSCWRGGSRRR
jgi:serine/threonine protein kinase